MPGVVLGAAGPSPTCMFGDLCADNLTVLSSGAREVTRRLTQAFRDAHAFASPFRLVSARALSSPLSPRPPLRDARYDHANGGHGRRLSQLIPGAGGCRQLSEREGSDSAEIVGY